MGISDWMGRLFGGGKTTDAPDRAADGGPDDEALVRTWRVQQALGNKLRLATRDALLARRRPLPFAEMPAFWGPTAAGLDEALSDAGFRTYLERLDPFAPAEPLVVVAGVEALVPCGEGQVVRFRLPAWHPEPQPGPDAGSDEVVATVAVDGSLTEPRCVGSLTISPRDDAPAVLDVVDEAAELRVVIGAAIPLLALAEEPSHLIGGLAGPIRAEDVEALEAAGYTQQDGAFVEALRVPVAAAGVDATMTSLMAPGLNVPCGLVGRGVPVGPAAQPLAAALWRGDRGSAEKLAAGAEVDILLAVAGFLAVSDRLDDAEWVLERAESGHPGRGHVAATIAELRGLPVAGESAGDAEARSPAESLFKGDADDSEEDADDPVADADDSEEDADSDHDSEDGTDDSEEGDSEDGADDSDDGEPEDGAGRQAEEDFVLAANRALEAWADDRPEDALQILQESPLVTRSWLGNLIDAVIHQEDTGAAFQLSPLRYHLAPILPAVDYARGGDLAEAERLLRRCLEIEPHHPSAAGTLALLLVGSRRHEECVAHCEAFIAKVGAFPYLDAIRAESLFALDRVEDAALALRRALEETPDHEAWWANLTLAMIALGRKGAARATLQELDGNAADLQLLQVLKRLI